MVLVFLAILPISLATINLDVLEKDVFNLGDTIKVSGNVVSDAETSGTLKLILSCEENEIQLYAKPFINMELGKIYEFNTVLPIPINMQGEDCEVVAEFNTETLGTEDFRITKELSGDFSLNVNEIQLGDRITLTGDISKLDGKLIDGFATIYFEKGDSIYLADSATVEDGDLIYTTSFTSMEQGDYNIDILVGDIYGNQYLFENVDTLKIYSDLVIESELEKNNYKPGEVLSLEGIVKEYLGGDVDTGEIIIKFDESEYKSKIRAGKFNYEMGIGNFIKSGYHDVIIKIIDENGNFGEKTLNVYIEGIQTALYVDLEKSEFLPKDTVSVTVNLHDQAGDAMVDRAIVKIKNVVGTVLLEEEVMSNEVVDYKLEDFAKPGEWTILVETNDLTAEKLFTVVAVKDLEIDLNGQVLEIKNIGNTVYDQDLELNFFGQKGDHTVYKRTNIAPGETFYLAMYKDVPADTYTVHVANTDISFNDVTIVDERSVGQKIGDYFGGITGSVVSAPGSSTSKSPLIGLVIILIVLAGLLVGFKRKSIMRLNKNKEKEVRLGKKVANEIQKSGGKKKSRFNFGKPDSADVEYFKRKVVGEMKEQQQSVEKPVEPEKKSRYYNFDRPLEPKKERSFVSVEKPKEPEKKPEEGNKGLFGIFD